MANMVLFSELFPEIAGKETRCLIFTESINGLTPGEYALLESYCNDPDCDCRRVFINVIYNGITPLATIGYGLDIFEFHEEWCGDKEFAKVVKGPILELTGYGSKYDKQILELFKKMVIPDTAYIERLKKHYKMFKEQIKKMPHLTGTGETL